MPLSTVGAVCRRLGRGRLLDLERRRPIVRYQRDRAGELIHLDIKRLARIERVGHQIRGDRSRTVDGAGWKFLHVCIDDVSRVAYAEVLPDEKGLTCTGFLRGAAAWLEPKFNGSSQHVDVGLLIPSVQSDVGSGQVHRLPHPEGSRKRPEVVGQARRVHAAHRAA